MMKKLWIWLLCWIQVLATCLAPAMKADAAQTKAAKKIISVVYDDSGSMWNDNDSWAVANYAMQAFAGLLNADDEMYITYMSDVGTAEEGAKEVNLTDPQGAVDGIRTDCQTANNTPLQSVEIALDKLKTVKSSDDTDQYWLVILTDGAMNTSGAKSADLQSLLNSCKGMTMNNGSSLQIYYMGIGGNAITVKDDPGMGLYSIMAGNDIVPALSDVANKVSGRMKFANSEISQVDGKTVKLYSEIPLYSIAVFSQNSRAQLIEAKGDNKFHIDRNVRLESPHSVLFGNAALVTNGANVIQPGEYTIVFSEDISLEDTVFMYQMAIEMKPVITKNGVTLDDVNDVVPGDVIDIELVPVNPETGDAIDESKLPSGITWGIGYSVNGSTVKESQSRTLTGVTVQEGENKITCTMQIPDYAPMVQTITFTPVDPAVYGISVIPSDDDVYNRNKLGLKNCLGTPDRFYLTADGVVLGKMEAEEAIRSRVKLEVVDVQIDDSMLSGFWDTFGTVKAPVKLKLQDDGSFVVYPGKSLTPAFMVQAGDYTVTLEVTADKTDSNSCTVTGTFYVNPRLVDWLDLFILLIIILLIARIIFLVFFKPRFPKKKKVVVEGYRSAGKGKGSLDPAFCGDTTLKSLPRIWFGATRQKIKVINQRAYAVENETAYLKAESVEGFSAFGYGNSAVDPKESFKTIVTGLDTKKKQEEKAKERKNKKKYKKDYKLKTEPLYLYNGDILYRVTLESKVKKRRK